MSKTHSGYLFIADITGYTRFLSESELEHAQETLTALLEMLVDHTRPPLVISRLAGDAVISYGLQENFFNGQSFLEKIEDTYIHFRQRINLLVLNNNCHCNACANIGSLDLKFFVHFGAFGIQRISDHDELVGSDVNLLHRLLKNTVKEATEFGAYALYTNAALQEMGLDGSETGMIRHRESYEHLGEVEIWVQDMHRVWEDRKDSLKLDFSGRWIQKEIEIDAPLEVVWHHLASPETRHILIGADRIKLEGLEKGRISPGSIYQCYHGDRVIPQTVLEWVPFERMIVKQASLMSSIHFLVEYCVAPSGNGTRLVMNSDAPDGPLFGRLMIRAMNSMLRTMMEEAFAAFKDAVEAAYQPASEAGKVLITAEMLRAAAREGAQEANE